MSTIEQGATLDSVGQPVESTLISQLPEDMRGIIAWIKKCIRLRGLKPSAWTAEKEVYIYHFITRSDIPRLFAYMSASNELLLVTGKSFSMAPLSFFYFVKRTNYNYENLTPTSIKSMIQFGFINSDSIDSMKGLMSTIYLPVVKSSDAWPESVKVDIASQTQRFMSSLVETSFQLKGKTVLYIPNEDIPVDVKHALADNELVKRLEASLVHWTRQIKAVAANQDEQGPSVDNGGPLELIEYCTSRFHDLSGITEQLRDPTFVRIVDIVRESGSSYVATFDALTLSMHQSSEEAAEVLKYLSVLKPSFERLLVANPTEIMQLIPEILLRIRVIADLCKYYHSENHLTNLLHRVSNAILQRCTALIDVSQAFSGDVISLNETLEVCIQCCVTWRSAYDEMNTVDAVNSDSPTRKEWNLDTTSIFAHSEAFIQRCRDLQEICSGQVQFSRRCIPNSSEKAAIPSFSGPRGPDIVRFLGTLDESFSAAVHSLRPYASEALNIKSVKWSESFNRFRSQVKDVEAMMSNTINDAFAGLSCILTALDIFDAFLSMSTRPRIRSLVLRKTAVIFGIFTQHVALAKESFETNSANPPRSPESAPFSGAALWARGFQKEIEKEWELIETRLPQTIYNVVPVYVSSRAEALSLSDKFLSTINDYMLGRHTEWLRESQSLDHQSLQTRLSVPLIIRSSTSVIDANAPQSSTSSSAHSSSKYPYLRSNFDTQLLTYFTEIYGWEQFEGTYLIPFAASDLLHNSGEQLRVLRQYVSSACDEYNSVLVDLTDDERRLFAEAISRLDRKTVQGLGPKLTWLTRTGKEAFARDLKKAASETAAAVRVFKKGRVEISALVEQLRQLRFFSPDKSGPVSPGVFQSVHSTQAQSAAAVVAEVQSKISGILARLYSLFANDGPGSQRAWYRFVRSVDRSVESAIRESVREFLRALETGLRGPTALLSVDAVLVDSVITFLPGFDSVTNAIRAVSRAGLTVADGLQWVSDLFPIIVPHYNATEAAIRSLERETMGSNLHRDHLDPTTSSKEKEKEKDISDSKTREKVTKEDIDSKASLSLSTIIANNNSNASTVARADSPRRNYTLEVQNQYTLNEGMSTHLNQNSVTISHNVRSDPQILELLERIDTLANESPLRLDIVRANILRLNLLRDANISGLPDMNEDESDVSGSDGASSSTSGSTMNLTWEELSSLLTSSVEVDETVRNDLPPEVEAGFIKVDNAQLKLSLLASNTRTQTRLRRAFLRVANMELEGMHVRLSTAQRLLAAEPSSVEELLVQSRLLQSVRADAEATEAKLRSLEEMLEVMPSAGLTVSEAQQDSMDSLNAFWRQFQTELPSCDERLRLSGARIKASTADAISALADAAADHVELANSTLPTSDETTPQEALLLLQSWSESTAALRARQQALLPALHFFGLTAAEFPALDALDKKVENLRSLWIMVQQWQERWVALAGLSLGESIRLARKRDPQEVSDGSNELSLAEDVEQRLKALQALSSLENTEVWRSLSAKLKDFALTLAPLQSLSSPALRPRHIAAIEALLGFSLDLDDETLTLAVVRERGISRQSAFIEEIAENAEKEAMVEKTLSDIEGVWAGLVLDLAPHKNIYLRVRSIEDVSTALDDQTVTVENLRVSRFYEVFSAQIDHWEKCFATISDTLEALLTVQRAWMYLESIFVGSEDVRRMLPQEAAEFDSVNAQFTALLKGFQEMKLVYSACLTPGLMNVLTELTSKLDTVQKALEKYLETKRMRFPRFYFVSNDDLLDILSHSKEPQEVQKHLRKCFEGIGSLTLVEPRAAVSLLPRGADSSEKEKGKDSETSFAERLSSQSVYNAPDATEIISPDGERMPLVERVTLEGTVEQWLLQLERVMQLTVLSSLRETLVGLRSKDREAWIQNHPGQMLISSAMLLFTTNVEKQLRSQQPLAGVLALRTKQVAFLNKLASIVRGSSLSAISRTKATALITCELHARDVLERMARADISSPSDFVWRSQLRLELVPEAVSLADSTGSVRTSAGAPLVAHQAMAKLDFGFEYQGNNGRLVITPLTDRCVLTLTTALSTFRGGAPAGPAGTGKTETVKDLGKNLAKFVVVFNCSDGLDYQSVGRLFSGLVQSGGWGCFDEFNRIEVEVLSVVAQQVTSILTALKGKKQRFTFMESEVPLNNQCGLFITMNPGYAGRSELPDNLKALFRPVAMTLPDLALITEVMLQSEGFQGARALARKTVTLYSLMTQQLSKQDHYDFGLRSLRGVLMAAGAIRRTAIASTSASPVESEEMTLLRALKAMNAPKFIAADAVLFGLLLSDLFPGVELPVQQKDPLMVALEQQLAEMRLQPVAAILRKAVELHASSLTRHCNMLVGQALAGKTTVWRALAGALTSLADSGTALPSAGGAIPFPVFYEALNPKALTVNELYGSFDPQTMEWSDGVLSRTFRQFARPPERGQRQEARWIVLDGPVDTLWIESMNTVMDDNRTLTLVNGDRISMIKGMSLLFEVADLAVASPATVSRAGMVYCDVSELQLSALTRRWLNTRFSNASNRKPWEQLFDRFLEPLVRSTVRECTMPVPLSPLNMTISLLGLLDSIIVASYSGLSGIGFIPPDQNPVSTTTTTTTTTSNNSNNNNPSTLPVDLISKWFFFALVWSVGGGLDDGSRRRFSELLRTLDPLLPPAGTVFDYAVDVPTRELKLWSERLHSNLMLPRDIPLDRVVVPTVDTLRQQLLLDTLLLQSRSVLLTGATASGKTILMNRSLSTLPPNMTSATLLLSAAMSARALQDAAEQSLERSGRGRLAPASGKKLIFFMDDFALPTPDTFGSQPPLELMRLLLGHGGWHDRHKGGFLSVHNVTLAGAMAPPARGSTMMSPRITQLFHILNFALPSEKSARAIFEAMLMPRFADFADEVRALLPNIVQASYSLLEQCQSSFLPTPTTSHYQFSLRDMQRLVSGLMLVNPRDLDTREGLLKLWAHECSRVFADRLSSTVDLRKFHEIIDTVANKSFDMYARQLNEGCDDVDLGPAYTSFFYPPDKNSSDSASGKMHVPTPTPSAMYAEPVPVYTPTLQLEPLRRYVEQQMQEYNNSPGMQSLSLIFFNDALRHLCRAHRVLLLPRGHALLVGVGGSGRQSLARLAAFLTQSADSRRVKCSSVEVSKNYRLQEFKDDLRKLVLQAGMELQPTLLLVTDQQLTDERFLEELSVLIASGDPSSVFDKEQRSEALESIRKLARLPESTILPSAQPDQLWSYFVDRVRLHFHVFLAISPAGSSFRERLRRFPALLNCCAMDWYLPWPYDALLEVAVRTLSDAELLPAGTEFLTSSLPVSAGAEAEKLDVVAIRRAAAQVCAEAHRLATLESEKMRKSSGRVFHITPTSFLEMVKGYKSIALEKLTELGAQRQRLFAGLSKLEEGSVQVSDMKVILAEKQRSVTTSAAEAEALLTVITHERRNAEQQRAQVQESSQRISVEKEECDAALKSAENDLAAAMPALLRADEEVSKLDAKMINEMKSYQKPPEQMGFVMTCVMTIFGLPVDWATAKKKLNETDFLKQIMTFRDTVHDLPASILKKLAKLLGPNPGDYSATAFGCSAAVGALYMWVMAIFDFYTLTKTIEPKKQAARAAESQLSEKLAALAKAQEELDLLMKRVEEYNAKHVESLKKRAQLQAEASKLTDTLRRAESLIVGLSDERTRWADSVQALDAQLRCIAGDSMLAAAMMAYGGAFEASNREFLVEKWSACVHASGVPIGNVNFATFLSGPALVQRWHSLGLPQDPFSVENAIIVTRGRRWPLLIDPQGQAITWLKAVFTSEVIGDSFKIAPTAKNSVMKGNQNIVQMTLKICDTKKGDYLRDIEHSIQLGQALLLQDIGEELDSVLEPVLKRSLMRQGTRDVIKLGDKTFDYNHNFRFFMATRLSNPVYAPEVSAQVSLVNFAVREAGLQEQLLAQIVGLEKPVLETQKAELVNVVASGRMKLLHTEDVILRQLSESKVALLDDLDLIAALQASKVTSEEVKKALDVAVDTQAHIDAARESYRPAAAHAAMLFFVLMDMSRVNPMYVTSLDRYFALFEGSVTQSAHPAIMNAAMNAVNAGVAGNAAGGSTGAGQNARSNPLEVRISAVNNFHTYEVYSHVSLGVFEKDKLLFSFLLASRIRARAGSGAGFVSFSAPLYNFILKGYSGASNSTANSGSNSVPPYLNAKQFGAFSELASTGALGDVLSSLFSRSKDWQLFCTHTTPETLPLPADVSTQAPDLARLAILRALRPDRVLAGMSQFVTNVLGARFLDSPVPDLAALAQSSSVHTPLLFLLSPGADPYPAVAALAQAQGVQLETVSLGQGQTPLAQRLIQQSLRSGGWVLLQNCHLSGKWLPELERIIEQYSSQFTTQQAAAKAENSLSNNNNSVTNNLTQNAQYIHPSFRLWLSSAPHAGFPLSIVRRSLKITTEPPRGLKANMTRLLNSLSETEFNARSHAAPGVHAPLLFALAWTHSILVERSKFRTLGYTTHCGFTDSDFGVSVDVITEYCAGRAAASVPWDAIRYLIAEVNYGGRVMDDLDRRIVITYVNQYFSGDTLKPRFHLSQLQEYFIPDNHSLANLKQYIGMLPSVDSAYAFGQHENADITRSIAESEDLLSQALYLMPSKGLADAPVSASAAAAGEKDKDVVPMKSKSKLASSASTGSSSSNTNASAASSSNAEETVTELSGDARMKALIQSALEGLPAPVDPLKVQDALQARDDPAAYCVVLQQECERYSRLLRQVSASLRAVLSAIEGSSVMTSELEAVYASLDAGKVPLSWQGTYPSLLPLGAWLIDLNARVKALYEWIFVDPPACVWLGGLTYPSGFLTAVLQTYARDYTVAIDSLDFSFPVLSEPAERIIERPRDGAYISGVYLEGAKWSAGSTGGSHAHTTNRSHTQGTSSTNSNASAAGLDEPELMQLVVPMPVIHFLPVILKKSKKSTSNNTSNNASGNASGTEDMESGPGAGAGGVHVGTASSVQTEKNSHVYKCPMYLYPVRTGSRERPSFVTMVDLNSGSRPPEFWIKRGTALLLSLDN